MKQLVHILLILVVGTALWGCRHSRTVAALVEADSLMWTRPDSSLALVQSVSPDTLDDENRAYHALLLTQAQFRNNIYPDTDTIINRALDFYADNHNRERLTRSLIYKGAVYEFSGRHRDALNNYFIAENNASSDDHINLAQIYMRIGYTYNKEYARDMDEIRCYDKALKQYTIIDNKTQMGVCEGNIASAYRKICVDSAYSHYRKCLLLLNPVKDSVLYWTYRAQLARAYLIGEKYREAISVSLDCYDNLPIPRNEVLYDLTDGYLKLNRLDSAEYYFSLADTINANEVEIVSRYWSLAGLYWAKGDSQNFRLYEDKSRSLARSIIQEKHNSETFLLESDFTITNLNKENYGLSKKNRYLLTISTIVTLLVIILSLLVILLRYKHKIKIVQANSLISALQNEKLLLEEDKKQWDTVNEELYASLKHQIETMQSLIHLSYQFTNSPSIFMKEFKKHICVNRPNESFWINLKIYVNKISDNLIDDISDAHELTNDETDLLCMEYLGFSNIQEMICLGFTNETSISNKKHKIAQKIGTQLTLKSYLNKLRNHR